MKIGIITGSVRTGRVGASVAEWVHERAQERGGDVEYVALDLAEFDLPILDMETIPGAAKRNYPYEQVTRWSEALDECDGYILVTPEYNHGVPGALKNAFDWISPEVQGKAAALVSYGAESGVRAVEQWRLILANYSIVVVRAQVSLSSFLEFTDGAVTPNDRRPKELANLFDSLEDAVRRQQS